MPHDRLDGWVDPQFAFHELFRTAPFAFWIDRAADAGSASLGRLTRMGQAAEGCSVLLGRLGRPTVLLDPATGIRSFDERDPLEIAAGARAGEDGSWWGWLGYEWGAERAGAPVACHGEPGRSAPDVALLYSSRVITFDHRERRIELSFEVTADGFAWAARTRSALMALATAKPGEAWRSDSEGDAAVHAPDASAAPQARWRHDENAYLGMIARCLEHIRAGDAYQLCLTNEAVVDGHFDPLAVYERLRSDDAAAPGGYLRFGAWALLSASPEEFAHVDREGVIRTRPIKGTRRRGRTPAEDDLLRTELRADPKERAENLMIVDLMRNDLERIATPGTVAVTGLFEVETLRHVHQLVSTLEARIAPGTTVSSVLDATFPAGSMTGAPKHAAMTLLQAMEGGRRGVYSGCFGRIGSDGSLELAMTIRSIVIGPTGATVGAGGGITAGSVPGQELAEVALKARALLAALGVGTPERIRR